MYLQFKKRIAAALFGVDKIKTDLEHLVAPMSMPVFCHRKDKGFVGEDVGISAKLCNNFFPSPTDIGICLTKNLDIKKIMNTNQNFEPLFESDKRQPNQNIEGGTFWGEVTFVFYRSIPDK